MTDNNGTTQSFNESPASWNTRFITPDGFTCQLTLRADTGTELLERAKSALSFLREQGNIPFYGYSRDNGKNETSPQEKVIVNHSSDDPAYCPIHQCEMKRWEKGGKVWYSHKTPDGWCNGKPKNCSKE
jgi:hypothetical protein